MPRYYKIVIARQLIIIFFEQRTGTLTLFKVVLVPCSPEVMVISETKLKNINYNITSIENCHFH